MEQCQVDVQLLLSTQMALLSGGSLSSRCNGIAFVPTFRIWRLCIGHNSAPVNTQIDKPAEHK